jgi:hypothetical protein
VIFCYPLFIILRGAIQVEVGMRKSFVILTALIAGMGDKDSFFGDAV